MRFRCSRERLLSGLQAVGSVVSSRGMKPIYESVLILTRDGALQLKGTDLEVAIRFTIEDETLSVEEPGSLVVNASKLTQILREVRDEEIAFVWENNALAVDCRGSHFKVMGLPPEEFPDIPDFPEDAASVLPASLFKRMVARTAFATAKEKMRYALNGVLFLLDGSTLTMVGTDGRRLAHSSASIASTTQGRLQVIVPTKGMSQMARVIGEEQETVEVALKDNQLSLRTTHAVVVSRLVEGTFPNFEEVIPVNCERRATVDREELIGSIRKASILTSKESQSVRFSFSETELNMTARADNVGNASVGMAIEYVGEPLEMAFNPAYVIEGLNAMSGETVAFEFRTPTSPAKITDGPEYTYVVMPIEIQ